MNGLSRIHGRSALVLAAHGSVRDPESCAQVHEYAREVARRGPFDAAIAAFHLGSPNFGEALDRLEADRVVVVPFLAAEGHFCEEVLPEALRRNHRFASITLRQTPPLGTHPGFASVIARRVSLLLAEHGLSRQATTLLLVGHGTERHERSRASTLTLVEALRHRRVAGEVRAAFLDDEPPVEQVVQEAAGRDLLVVPFLMGGAHALTDLPARLGLSTGSERARPLLGHRVGGRVVVDGPAGGYDGVVDLLFDLAVHHLPIPRRFPPRPRGQTHVLAHAHAQVHAPAHPPRPASGAVFLVGAGPGDAGLITVKGRELLERADVVLHDRLIGPELLRVVRPGATVVDVGKAPGGESESQAWINHLLVQHARDGQLVVRLKGGDPMVFGRGAEELSACQEAGVPCEVVPGVSSAIAVPASVGIPVTLRGVARSFAVVTAHMDADGAEAADERIAALAGADTLVILMGRGRLAEVARVLIKAGRKTSTPAACIQDGTLLSQRSVVGSLGTIANLADAAGLGTPSVIVVGDVAAWGIAAASSGSEPLAEAASC
jgi:uroporphyrin-III C-methyltransferase